jgi:hypothetical protein
MKVRLSKRVLEHIVSTHPEVTDCTQVIVETVQNPDRSSHYRIKGELEALKFYPELHIGLKYLLLFTVRWMKKGLL